MQRFFLTSIFVLLFSLPAFAEDSAVATLFAREGVDGTIVISSLSSVQTFIHNDSRAQQRFPCASTFKILNTLIALEEKAVTGKDDVLKWNGLNHEFLDWNRDQTLESAFRVSCVWCYQELARRIGPEKYRNYIRKTTYGVLREPFETTTFWLDGSLQISATEQVEFLKKIYVHSPPFSAASYETLRHIMLVENAPSFSTYAKTGWAARANPQIGWYVGYVETADEVWFFATNIEIRTEKDLLLRQKLTRESLQEKGIIKK